MRSLTIGSRAIRVCSAVAAEDARPELNLSIRGIVRHWHAVCACLEAEESIHLDALAYEVASANNL